MCTVVAPNYIYPSRVVAHLKKRVGDGYFCAKYFIQFLVLIIEFIKIMFALKR